MARADGAAHGGAHLPPRGDDHTVWFAGAPEAPGGDAIETAWMEAGPDLLTVIRDGRVLHQGHHAQGLPEPSKPRAFFQQGRTYSTQDGYTAPEQPWSFDCRHVTTTPDGDAIAFGFVRVGRDGWDPHRPRPRRLGPRPPCPVDRAAPGEGREVTMDGCVDCGGSYCRDCGVMRVRGGPCGGT